MSTTFLTSWNRQMNAADNRGPCTGPGAWPQRAPTTTAWPGSAPAASTPSRDTVTASAAYPAQLAAPGATVHDDRQGVVLARVHAVFGQQGPQLSGADAPEPGFDPADLRPVAVQHAGRVLQLVADCFPRITRGEYGCTASKSIAHFSELLIRRISYAAW
jgi:hypothetical protein